MASLDALNVAGTVGGSLASPFAGEPRFTLDIDLVAAIDEPHIDGTRRLPSHIFLHVIFYS